MTPRLILWSLVLLLLLTACLPPDLPSVVKIGLVAPFEGRYRYIGYDAIYAARLAVREINAAGGAGGRRLELVAYDDRCDTDLAQDAARNLSVAPDVVGVIGHYCQDSTAAVAPLYTEAGLPLIVVGAWLTESTTSAWHLMPPPTALAEIMVQMEPGVPSVGLWGAGPLIEALEVVTIADENRTLYPADAVPRPEIVFSALPPVEAAEQLVTWRSSGWAGSLIGGPTMASSEFVEVAGEDAESVRFVTPYPLPQDLLYTTQWIADYRKVGPHVPEPGPYALPTYEAVYLLAEAIAAGATQDDIDRGHVVRALPEVTREGLLGRITWDAGAFWEEAAIYRYRWSEGQPFLTTPSGAGN